MRGFLNLTWVEMKLFWREWQAVFFTFIFWPMLLAIFGAIFRNDPQALSGDFGSVDLLVPGFIAIGIATNALFTIGGVLSGYRERGILRRFQATPLRPTLVLAAQLLVAYAMTLLSALLLILLARLLFGLRVGGGFPLIFAAFSLSAFSLFSLGFLVGSLFHTARITYAVSTTVLFSMIPLSGALFTIDVMPPFMQVIAQIIPLTYAVQLLRDVWLGQPLWASWVNIVALAVLLVACASIGSRMFRWS